MRFRNVFIFIGSAIALLLLLSSDPDLGLVQNLPFGAGTMATLIILFKAILGITMLHFCRKALMDYTEADFQLLGRKALETSEGAGLYAIAVAVMSLAIALAIGVMVAYG